MRRKQNPSKRSLGGLRPVTPTSPNAPQFLGKMTMQRSTLLVLIKQLNEGQSGEVICNLAGWHNSKENDEFLTVEISPRYIPKKPESAPIKQKSDLRMFC